jgi:hypothetical protein
VEKAKRLAAQVISMQAVRVFPALAWAKVEPAIARRQPQQKGNWQMRPAKIGRSQ